MRSTLCTSIVLIHLCSIDSNSIKKQETDFPIASLPSYVGNYCCKVQAVLSSQLTFGLTDH